jgi:hypothetical protein
VKEATWRPIETLKTTPNEDDARQILVWHVYQGVMVSDTKRARRNPFHAYWMEIPNWWIDTGNRLPEEKDSNAQKCVLARDSWGDCYLRRWDYLDGSQRAAAWQRTPDAPPDAKELRKRRG